MTDSVPTTPTRASLILLSAEFVVLFLAVPLVIALRLPKQLLIPAIAAFGLFALALLLTDSTFNRRELWNAGKLKAELSRMLLFAAAAMIGITALVLILDPRLFGSLVRERPALWITIMLGYPLASVYPQEVIYRAFIFHRYRVLFRHPGVLIAASAIAFGYAHIVLWNWLAIGATLIGGLLFAWTFHRTRSVAATWLEHALYGCFMFTVGLGRFFYGGAAESAVSGISSVVPH